MMRFCSSLTLRGLPIASYTNHVMALRNTKTTTADDILLYANDVSGLHRIAVTVCKILQSNEEYSKKYCMESTL